MSNYPAAQVDRMVVALRTVDWARHKSPDDPAFPVGEAMRARLDQVFKVDRERARGEEEGSDLTDQGATPADVESDVPPPSGRRDLWGTYGQVEGYGGTE